MDTGASTETTEDTGEASLEVVTDTMDIISAKEEAAGPKAATVDIRAGTEAVATADTCPNTSVALLGATIEAGEAKRPGTTTKRGALEATSASPVRTTDGITREDTSEAGAATDTVDMATCTRERSAVGVDTITEDTGMGAKVDKSSQVAN